MSIALKLFCRLLVASFANVTTFPAIIIMAFLVLELITELASAANVFASQDGRAMIVLAEILLTLAFHHVICFLFFFCEILIKFD